MANDVSRAYVGILEQAAQDFGNHACNDHYLEDTPANRSLAQRVEPDFYGPDAECPMETGPEGIFVFDSSLLYYLVEGLREGRIAIIEKD